METIERDSPDGEIVVSSGVSPSGAYHLGTLREIMTAEAIAREFRLRGRDARHIHVSDDYDVFRKVPADIDESYSQYLGMPLSDMPAPDGSDQSYADFYVADLMPAAQSLNMDMELIRANERYKDSFFTEAIEKSLENIDAIRSAIEEISGRSLDPQWSPIQVVEDGRLKNRLFVSINTEDKTVTYLDAQGEEATVSYEAGNVKLNWRIDWPARWWLLGVDIEPFGRDHATKGGSYDTGEAIVRDVFGAEPPHPVPYNFINKAGETKKMSKSKGDSVTAAELLRNVPAEVVWFFMLRMSPDKLLFFDTAETLIKLFDEFSELLSKEDKTEHDEHLLKLCLHGVDEQTISRVPFTHLFESYQSSLRDPHKTLEIIRRTEYAQVVDEEEEIILRELKFIDSWLDTWAPENATFTTYEGDVEGLSDTQMQFLRELADTIEKAPEDADGEWFHKAIYDYKEALGLTPKELFGALYQSLINKSSGPRAGWFISMLPRDWVVNRLRNVNN